MSAYTKEDWKLLDTMGKSGMINPKQKQYPNKMSLYETCIARNDRKGLRWYIEASLKYKAK